MKKQLKKILWNVVYAAVFLFMAASIFIYMAPHFGWRASAVLTGSMEPAVPVGALIISQPVDPEEVQVGDIILFRPVSVGETMITHRVVAIGSSGIIFFHTKGDANETVDPFAVPAPNLVGKVIATIPHWGYFTEFLKTPFGYVFAVVIPGVILLIAYVTALTRAVREYKRERTGKGVGDGL